MKNNNLFYGWIVVTASTLGVSFSVMGFIPSTMGIMIGPVGGELGWSPPQMYMAINCATLITVVIAPMVGQLVDRFGCRKLVVFSFIAQAVIIFSFQFLTDNIYLFYLRYALLALLATGATGLAFSTLISRWFDQYRGIALGITLSGMGIGGVIWSLGTNALFNTVGWRDAFLYIALFIGLFVAPILYTLVRDDPSHMGLPVDGRTTKDNKPSLIKKTVQGHTLRQAMSKPHYWLAMVAFFIFSFGAYGISLNLVPMLISQGSTPALAATVQASMWAVVIFGRILSGWLLDRFFAPYVAIAFGVPVITGILLMAVGLNGPWAFLAAMMVGLTAGAEADILAYLTSRYFGLKHYALIYATFFSTYALGTGLGPYTTSLIAQNSGYPAAMFLLAGLLTIALFLLTRLPKYQAANHN